MSYSEGRIHFDKAKNSTVDPALKDIAEGLRHLSHAIEEDIRKLEEDIRAIEVYPSLVIVVKHQGVILNTTPQPFPPQVPCPPPYVVP